VKKNYTYCTNIFVNISSLVISFVLFFLRFCDFLLLSPSFIQVGREHVWTVNVGGQTGSGTPTTSYTLPMIRSILPKIATFSGISTGGFGHSTCTTGYDSYSPCMVKLSGTNFGPALVSNPITAAYNNGIYTATDCEVIVADTVIECRSVEKKIGSSIGHTWVVTVGSQSSLASVATTRYAAPQITSISTNAGGGLSGLSTDGRDRITMTGTNFGKMGTLDTSVDFLF